MAEHTHDNTAAQTPGRTLAQPNQRWLGDRGEADPAVRAALAKAAVDDPNPTTAYLRAVAALGGARLLMPIVASGDESMDGPDPDRHAEMAAVSVRNAAGQQALLAFTGADAMNLWQTGARPVPGDLSEVAATVGEAGCDLLLVDAAGPAPLVVGGDVVEQLAQGRRLVELEDGGFGWMFVQRDE
ncbi:SseB family protein [Propionibacteriaceae bacterium G1746]|uniref:SseB family protein n=1 Tax=Aestuariimicrobium sp. G57 TaxID=3418485 RepID=UPI003C1B267E